MHRDQRPRTGSGGSSRRGHRAEHGRKERVLHTRVSERLAEDIRRTAEDLRVPVSNLVRNLLEEAFQVVEAVSDDVGDFFEEVLDEAEAARARLERARGRRRRPRRGAPERGSTPPLPVSWFFVEAGRAVGPRSGEELAGEIRGGRVGPDTLVWCAGMAAWSPAAGVEALAPLFAPPPVPGSGVGTGAEQSR
jgi:hypothetical protein